VSTGKYLLTLGRIILLSFTVPNIGMLDTEVEDITIV
jgi:hypothetical protein